MSKHAGRLGLCIIGVCAVLTLGCSGSKESRSSEMQRHSLSRVNALYAEMENCEVSDLKEDLSGIIKERLTCYSDNLVTMERVRECRKKYVRSIVAVSRSRIKSAPKLGDSILCFQYCPISEAVCQGDNIDNPTADCVLKEVQCIEYCLDMHWRGGTPWQAGNCLH